VTGDDAAADDQRSSQKADEYENDRDLGEGEAAFLHR